MGNRYNNKTKYPNARLALEEMHTAYAVENERKRTLDGKANAFMTVNIAILTIYIPQIPFEQLLKFFHKTDSDGKTVVAAFLVLLLCGGVSLLVAFKMFAEGYSNKKYAYLNVDSLLNVAATSTRYKEGVTEKGIVDHYHYILRGTIDDPGNIKVNNERAELIQKGIKATGIGFGLISIATVAIRIFMGGM